MKGTYKYTKEELHTAQLDIYSVVPYCLGIPPEMRIDWFEENIRDLFIDLKITEEEKQKMQPKTQEIAKYLLEKYKEKEV